MRGEVNGRKSGGFIKVPLAFVYGVILSAVELVVGLVVLAQFFYTLILGKRHKGMARFANNYASLHYHILRYTNFATNERPLFGGPGWEEVLPCDFDREDRRKAYEELKDEFDQML